MRVALLSRAVHPWHGFGGLERHVAALKRHLTIVGCDVLLFTMPPSTGSCLDRGEGDQGLVFVSHRRFPWPRMKGFVVLDRSTNYLAWSLKAGEALLATHLSDSAGIDIVQADAGAGFGYALRRPQKSPPLVLHPHGMEEFKVGFLKRSAYFPLRWAIRYTAARAEKVLVPDAAMGEEVETLLGVEPRRTVVIPNAIDLDEVDLHEEGEGNDGLFERLALAPSDRLLLSVGRLEANKGFGYLIEALGMLRGILHDRRGSSWRWVLVGEGPERARLEREVRARGIEAETRFAGRLSDDELDSLYRRAEIFCHPTLFEGSSQVTLEAMARRLPVIATRVGGIPDKVESGKTGLLVRAGDAMALAAAVRCVMELDEGTRRQWGERGRKLVEQKFSWSRRARELVALYQEILSPDSSSPPSSSSLSRPRRKP